jgi:hypothetical protein
MKLKKQTGFATLAVLILLFVGVSVAGGGYVLYKDKQQMKRFDAGIAEILKEEPEPQTTVMVSDKVIDSNSTKEGTINDNIKSSLSLPGVINCDSYDCLINAAKDCRASTGMITYSNISNPVISTVLSSGKTKYDIKPSGSSSCVLEYSFYDVSTSFTGKARADMVATGMTSDQIDLQIKAMNEGSKTSEGVPSICISDKQTIFDYLTDRKNGVVADMDFSFSADLTSGESKQTINTTTSSGKILTCKMEEPKSM